MIRIVKYLVVIFGFIIITPGQGGPLLAAGQDGDCFSTFSRMVAKKAMAFYNTRVREKDWSAWGIDENKRTLKIWVVPPAVGTIDNLEITGKSDIDNARLNLMRALENSLGIQLESFNKKNTKIRVVENSDKTVNRLVNLITGKYSRKIFRQDTRLEIGRISTANLLLRTTIIPGTKPELIGNFFSIETGDEFGFARDPDFSPERCSGSVNRQFALLTAYIIDYLPCKDDREKSTIAARQVLDQFLGILQEGPSEPGVGDEEVSHQEKTKMKELAQKIKKKLSRQYRFGRQMTSQEEWLKQYRANPNRLLLITRVEDHEHRVVNKLFFSVKLISGDSNEVGRFQTEWYKLN